MLIVITIVDFNVAEQLWIVVEVNLGLAHFFPDTNLHTLNRRAHIDK